MKWLDRYRERRRQDRIEWLRARCHDPGLLEREKLKRQVEFIAYQAGITVEEARRRWGPLHMEPLRFEGPFVVSADTYFNLDIKPIGLAGATEEN